MTAAEQAGTRDRLLDAAGALFAEKGFEGTSVADICQAGKANIAAVNYHFGNKSNLYREAWRHAHFSMLDRYPPDGGVVASAPPEERLRGRIRGILQRALLEQGLEFKIMRHEIANPTGLLSEVIRDTIRPLREAMAGIVNELLGGGADEQTVSLCVMSIIGPCMQVMRRQQVHAQQGRSPWFGPEKLEDMAEHFATFALAGLREIRQRVEHATCNEHARSQGETVRECM